MSDLNSLIRRYTIRYDQKLKKICTPLKAVGMTTFAYYTIRADGSFIIMSNYPKQLEFFYGEKLYESCPYLRHPSFFRSGADLIPLTEDPQYLELSKQQYELDHLFIMIQRCGSGLEGFFYTSQGLEKADAQAFLSKLQLFKRFNSYFKREARSLIQSAQEEGFNLSEAKKKGFFQDDKQLSLSSYHQPSNNFLKQISGLSPQEEKCLELFQQGHSAQATAAILGLSQRTVEHYFENIKNKLGCQTKAELIHW